MSLVIVDDRNAALKYSSGWSQAGIPAEYQQSTSFPLAAGSSVSYSFYGRSIQVIGTLPAELDSATISFQIDSNTAKDYNTPGKLTKALIHQTLFQSDSNLDPNTEHKLTITMKSTPPSNIGLWFFDYLLYEAPNTNALSDDSLQYFIDDSDSSVSFNPSSAWVTINDTNSFRNTFKNTTTKGSSVSYTFSGSQVSLYGRLNAGSSPLKAAFSVDSETPTTSQFPSQTGVTYNNQLFLSSTLSSSKQHTLKVEYVGGEDPLFVDYFLVHPAAQDSSSGGLPTGGIVGAVMGVVVGLAAIAGLVFFFLRRRRRKGWRSKARYSVDSLAPPLSPSTYATPFTAGPSLSSTVSRRPTGQSSHSSGIMDISAAQSPSGTMYSAVPAGAAPPSSYHYIPDGQGHHRQAPSLSSTGHSSDLTHTMGMSTMTSSSSNPYIHPRHPQSQAADSGYRNPLRSTSQTGTATGAGSKREMMQARMQEEEEMRRRQQETEMQPPAYTEQ